MFQGLVHESQGHNRALTVSDVPYSALVDALEASGENQPPLALLDLNVGDVDLRLNAPPGQERNLIPANALIVCFERNEICYTSALPVLV